MTVRAEAERSFKKVRDLLTELCVPGVRMSKKELRHRVKWALRHFPFENQIGLLPDCPTKQDFKDFERFRCRREDER
jgi:hypothetical protein